MSDDRPLNVLFLCGGNSARSIFAESIINRVGRGSFRGYSAGSRPRGTVHPYAIELLEKLSYRTSDLRSKDWSVFAGPDGPGLHFVFTLCDTTALEPCPVWPGQPMTAHWSIPDPAAVTGTEAEMRFAFSDVYRMLSNRISIFVNLPISSLDKFRLQKRLDDIGALTGTNA